MLDFSDRTRTGISILTSAADLFLAFDAFLHNCMPPNFFCRFESMFDKKKLKMASEYELSPERKHLYIPGPQAPPEA